MLDSEIKKTQQDLARLEKKLAIEKLRARKQDTRHKIQLGGLVIKAGMDKFPKSIILGALVDARENIQKDPAYKKLVIKKGEAAFMNFK